jgi:hypothetical protein
MNNNSKNKESDIFRTWEKAGNTLKNQQQINKKTMETMINNTSAEFTSSIKKLIKIDAIFKIILTLGYIIISAFNLDNLMVMLITLVCIIIVMITIKQERFLIEGIKELQEYSGGIRHIIERDIQFYKRNIFRFPLVLSVSVFLFYILGSLVYHAFKYDIIRPVKDLQDAIVLLSFLVLTVIISFVGYYPFFRKRINHLQHILKDIDNAELVSEHLDNQKARKRKEIIITSILVILGILVLISLIFIF